MNNNYCINCMRQLGDTPVCAHCGWDNSKPHQAEPYHLTPGTLLAGRYLVGKALGEGGFGITYIGLHTTLSKRVAIKEFYPSGAANRTSQLSEEIIITKDKQDFFRKGVDRFLLEAKNVASFPDEEGIVDVIDYFQENNTAYIVMEYIEGLTLKDYTRKNGLFNSDQLIDLALPLMKSLSVIHAQGIIHRDISPDNIMYTKRGKLKLMDFGSARYFTNEDRQMSIILKQGFAPEEQYRSGGDQGPHTDVYALCATIYACITGIVPVNSLERLAQDTLARPSKLGVAIKPHREDALMHGLAVRAKDRTPNMATLMREMTTVRSGYSQTATSTAPQRPPMQPPYMTQRQSFPTQQSYQPYPTRQTGQPQPSYNTRQTTGQRPPQPHNTHQTGQPQPKKKSRLPLFLGITIPAVVIAAIIVIIAIAATSCDNGSKPTMTTSGQSSVQKSTSSTASGSASADKTGLTAEEAVNYPSELAEMMEKALPDNDDLIQKGDKIEVQEIYYCDSKDSDYHRMIFLYHNATQNYYRTVQADPADIEIQGGAAVYNSVYYAFSDQASTAEDAISNNRILNASFRKFYDITEVMSGGNSVASTKSSDNSPAGLTVDEAKKNPTQLRDMMLDQIHEADSDVGASDKVEIKNIYYVEKPSDNYRRLVFVYQDVTKGFYRATEISPEYVEIKNGKAEYSIDYYARSDTADTLEQAKQNNFYLCDTYSKYYEITTVL